MDTVTANIQMKVESNDVHHCHEIKDVKIIKNNLLKMPNFKGLINLNVFFF